MKRRAITQKALEAMRKGNDFRYHSRMDQAQSKLAEMQALYDVNRLELEKSRLADRNKLFLLVAGGIVPLLLAGWAAYQQAMVRRLKLARTQFMAASEEAQAKAAAPRRAKKMKTAFINSMCHEIRTPLNAINGFSELLLTEQEPAARQAFQAEIWKSTTALTALLENMLELSQLVSSESPPRSPRPTSACSAPNGWSCKSSSATIRRSNTSTKRERRSRYPPMPST